MLSDRAKISLAKANYRRAFTGATTTTGALVSGKFYRITEFKSGDDFSNVGIPDTRCYPKGRSGLIFEATGTAPTTWTHGSSLTELKVAELRAKAAEMFAQVEGAQVAITSGSFEGGSGTGQLTFEVSLHIAALESLLAEFDPFYISEGTALPRRSSSIRVLV